MDVTEEMQPQARALADPSRFKLFRFIAEADGPVGVAELTALLGFNHNAIRQHLAVLVDAEIVSEFNERRSTPGRPRKQYRLRHDALGAFGSVSGSYQRLAELLLQLADSDDDPFDVGYRAGVAEQASAEQSPTEQAPADHGMSLDQAEQQLFTQLQDDGFAPKSGAGGCIELTNCPFADLAERNPGVICELHRGLINGFIATTERQLVGELVPVTPHDAACRVTLIDATEASR